MTSSAPTRAAEPAQAPADVVVIDDAMVAAAALDPLRHRILSALSDPGSASSVAAGLGLTRQKVNYHLRILEEHGLVAMVVERPRRGLTERIMVASAHSYVVSPGVLGDLAADPKRTDRLSARYLIALAGRLIGELSALSRAADRAGRPVAALAIDSDIRFASADDRARFTAELSETVADLAARYHDESAPDGRWHRLLVAGHPKPDQGR